MIRTRPRAVLALVFLVGTAGPAASQTTYTWQNVSGSWSTNGNWVGGVAPPAGGGADLTLRFVADVPIFTTNDRGNPFVVNNLTFATAAAPFNSAVFLTSDSGNTIRMAANGGLNPVIRLEGRGETFFDSTLTLAAPTTVNGPGTGGITFNRVIDGAGGLTIATSLLTAGSGLVTLSGANTFAGGVALTSGNLVIGSATALGTGTLTVGGGGTVRSGGGVMIGNAVSLTADLVYAGENTLTIGGPVNGGGGITHVGSGTLTLTGTNGYTGATVVGGPFPAGEFGRGTLILSGLNGTAASSSGFQVGPGAVLSLNSAGGNNSNRIGDTDGVSIAGGTFSLSGNASATTDETVGTLTAAGFARVSVSAGTNGARLTAAGLARVNNGTFTFDGTNLGGPLAGGSAQIQAGGVAGQLVGGNGAAGSTTVSILPYAARAGTSFFDPGSFVTYDGNGFRALTASEYATTIANGSDTANNVRLNGTFADITTDTRINALLLGGSFSTSGVTGTANLTITSGAVVSDELAFIATNLAFGSREAVFHVGTNAFSGNALNVSGVVAGTGGLTKSGPGNLLLAGANTYTGTTTINAGVVQFLDAAAFGASTSAIVINGAGLSPPFGGETGLASTGDGPGALGRNLTLGSGVATISARGGASRAAPLLLSGAINGPGGLSFDGATSFTDRVAYVLTGANTYTGPTEVRFSTTVVIPNDGVLGTGGTLYLAGTVSLAGAWITNRPVVIGANFGGDGEVATNGFNASIGGPIDTTFGSGRLVKSGAGRLTLTAESPFAAEVQVRGGELRLAGAGSLRAFSATVGAGAILTLDNNAGGNIGGRLSPGTGITLSNGELRLVGADGAPSADTVGFVSTTGTLGILTAAPGTGTGSARLTLGGLSVGQPGEAYLFRGAGLGSTPGNGVGSIFFPSGVLSIGGGGADGSTTISLVPAALGDATSAGLGGGFVTHNPTVGVRLLAANEYTTTLTSGTSSFDNVRLGSAVTVSAPTRVNALQLAAGGGLTLNSALALGSNNLFASGGATAISGTGALRFTPFFFSGSPAVVGVAPGSTLTVSAGIGGATSLTKLGAGTLILNGSVGAETSLLTVGGGTVRVGATPDLSRAGLTVFGGTTFDLNGNSKVVNGLAGGGSVTLGAGTLSVGRLGLLTGGEPDPEAGEFSGVISGSGGLWLLARVNQTYALTLSGVNTYTEQTRVGGNTTLTLTGPGTIGTSNSVVIGGAVVLDNRITNVANRLGGGVLLTGGSLAVTGNYLANSNLILSELIIGTGAARLELDAGPGRLLGLSSSSLTRLDGGTLFLVGDRVGAAAGTGRSNIVFTTAPTALLVGGGGAAGTPQISILPFAVAPSSFEGTTFVTYDGTNGLRAITPFEITPLVVGTSTTNNARVFAPTTISTATTVNALMLSSPIDGAATLTVTSGAVLVNEFGFEDVVVSAPLAFGPREGIFHLPEQFSPPLVVTGVVSGSGGLTKSGPGRMTLSGANTYTGQTFVSDGRLDITASVINGSAGPLGQSSAGVALAGGSSPTLGIGSAVAEFQRPFAALVAGNGNPILASQLKENGLTAFGSTAFGGPVTLDGYLTVRSPRSDITRTGFVFNGTVFGTGGLVVESGTTVLNGGNSYSGGTAVGSGAPIGGAARAAFTVDPLVPLIGLGTDTALGTGPLVVNGSALLRADNGARTIANAVLFPDGFTTLGLVGPNDLTLNGPVVFGTGVNGGAYETGTTGLGALLTLTFAGPVSSGTAFSSWTVSGGLARLTANNPFTGTLIVRADEVRLRGNGALPAAGTISIDLGARLELDNTAGNIARLPVNGFVSAAGGELAVRGAASAPTNEVVAQTGHSFAGSGTITVLPGAGGSASYQAGSVFNNGSTLLFRGTNLGDAPGNGVGSILATAVPTAGGNGTAGTPGINIIPGALGDRSAVGLGAGVVTLDPATGIRLLAANEYRNTIPAPGGGLENVRLTSFAAVGSDVGITSLTLGAGGTLTLAASLNLASGNLFAEAVNGSITGGTVQFGPFVGSGVVALVGVGAGADLTLGSRIASGTGLHKMGAGLLTVTGEIIPDIGTVMVAGGTLRLGAVPQIANSDVVVYRNATFDLAGNDKSIRGLIGPGIVQLGSGTLTVTGNAVTPFSGPFTGSIIGTGGLTLDGPMFDPVALVLEGANGYTGTTRIGAGDTLRLARNGTAASGSYVINGTFSDFFFPTGVLDLDDSQVVVANRLATSAGVTLNGGRIRLTGGAFTNSTHAIGVLTAGAVGAQVELRPDADHAVELTAASLARTPGATLEFFGPLVLGGPVGPGVGRVRFTTAPALVGGNGAAGTTTVSILPYAIAYGLFGGDIGLVTHDANGIRGLTDAEYAIAMPAGVTMQNVRLFGAASLDAATVINSLVLSGSVSGTGPLGVGSGAILVPFGSGTISTPVQFGPREGVIHVPGSSFLLIDRPVSGMGGLTVAGTGVLSLGAANTVTGPVRVGRATLIVNGALGPGVTVTDSGRLAGTGTVFGAVTIAGSARIAPGNGPGGAIGELTTGPLTLAPGSLYEWEIFTAGAADVGRNTGGSTTGGAMHDMLVVTGDLAAGGTLRVVPVSFSGFDPAKSYSWRVASFTGTMTGPGLELDTSLFPVPAGSAFDLGTSGGVIYLNYSPVPEPAGILLGTALGAAVVGFVRRRRSGFATSPTRERGRTEAPSLARRAGGRS